MAVSRWALQDLRTAALQGQVSLGSRTSLTVMAVPSARLVSCCGASSCVRGSAFAPWTTPFLAESGAGVCVSARGAVSDCCSAPIVFWTLPCLGPVTDFFAWICARATLHSTVTAIPTATVHLRMFCSFLST